MLFRLLRDKDFFEVNPGAKAIEEFDGRTSQQMWFVCLVADVDYDNPLRTLPDDKKRYHAALTAGYKMEPSRPDKNARNMIDGKVPTVEKAIAKHREIQYDEDKANIEALTSQIREARELMSADKKEAATIVTVDANGKEVKTVDLERAINLSLQASKLGTNIVSLIQQRDVLRAKMANQEPTVQVDTFSGVSFDDESKSMVDQLMRKE